MIIRQGDAGITLESRAFQPTTGTFTKMISGALPTTPTHVKFIRHEVDPLDMLVDALVTVYGIKVSHHDGARHAE